MSFPTLHPENKAVNLLDSALTLYPDLRPELREWVRRLMTTIAKPVPVPGGLDELHQPRGQDIDMERETFLLGLALCEFRRRIYPDGYPAPIDTSGGAARDDLESAMSRFEERLSRSRPKVELEDTPDAGDYYEGPDPRDEDLR